MFTLTVVTCLAIFVPNLQEIFAIVGQYYVMTVMVFRIQMLSFVLWPTRGVYSWWRHSACTAFTLTVVTCLAIFVPNLQEIFAIVGQYYVMTVMVFRIRMLSFVLWPT